RTALEVVTELAEHQEAADNGAEEPRDAGERSPPGAERTVLCAAGRSGLDLTVAGMLGQLLERRGFSVRVVSAEALAPEHVDAIDLDSVHAVCLSYLDPAALPRVKQTVRRLARQAPELP